MINDRVADVEDTLRIWKIQAEQPKIQEAVCARATPESRNIPGNHNA